MAFSEIFPVRPHYRKDAALRPTKNGCTLYLHPAGIETLATYGKTVTIGDHCQIFFDPETNQFAVKKNKDGQFTWRGNGKGNGLRCCINKIKDLPKTVTYKILCPKTLDEQKAKQWEKFNFLLLPVSEKEEL